MKTWVVLAKDYGADRWPQDNFWLWQAAASTMAATVHTSDHSEDMGIENMNKMVKVRKKIKKENKVRGKKWRWTLLRAE